MASNTPEPPLLALSELVIQKSTRGRFFTEIAITTDTDAPLAFAKVAGNKALLIAYELSDGWFFPSRPMDLEDENGQCVLRIELSGVVRRLVVTVRRPDGSVLGKLVGKTWATTFRNTGLWVEVNGERVGEINVGRHTFQIVDSVGTVLAEVERTPAQRRTRLDSRNRLSEPLSALVLAATVIRHRW
ncbi:hypothetical protein [Rhodococcus sp. NPDC058521]|uniref:hypothetical protein n=1 Tax=Rhodococcus sp. NPDC058521 TaxID=3346536 RepID=UPI0036503F41